MEKRSVMSGLLRGFGGRCPDCGQGKLFRKYLKVDQYCPACGHQNGAYKADDAPPYFTILIVGHLVIGPLLLFPFIWQWPVQYVLLATMPALLVLTLWLLPHVKGAVVGLHWALDAGRDGPEPQDPSSKAY
jgi:uncharacterized protein (DUF983 family)